MDDLGSKRIYLFMDHDLKLFWVKPTFNAPIKPTFQCFLSYFFVYELRISEDKWPLEVVKRHKIDALIKLLEHF